GLCAGGRHRRGDEESGVTGSEDRERLNRSTGHGLAQHHCRSNRGGAGTMANKESLNVSISRGLVRLKDRSLNFSAIHKLTPLPLGEGLGEGLRTQIVSPLIPGPSPKGRREKSRIGRQIRCDSWLL